MQTHQIQTIMQVRYRNLEGFRASQGLSIPKLAERLKMSRGQIYQLLGPKRGKGIGTRLARKIEQKLNKPEGWLDQTTMENVVEGAVGLVGLNLDMLFRAAKFLKSVDPKTIEAMEALIAILKGSQEVEPAEPITSKKSPRAKKDQN